MRAVPDRTGGTGRGGGRQLTKLLLCRYQNSFIYHVSGIIERVYSAGPVRLVLYTYMSPNGTQQVHCVARITLFAFTSSIQFQLAFWVFVSARVGTRQLLHHSLGLHSFSEVRFSSFFRRRFGLSLSVYRSVNTVQPI